MRRPGSRGSINSGGMNSDSDSDDGHRSSSEALRKHGSHGSGHGHGHGHGHSHDDGHGHSHAHDEPPRGSAEVTPLLSAVSSPTGRRERNPEHMKEARAARNRLLLASVLCTVFMIGEVIGGFFRPQSCHYDGRRAHAQ
eukprot:Opistho-1_new@88218